MIYSFFFSRAAVDDFVEYVDDLVNVVDERGVEDDDDDLLDLLLVLRLHLFLVLEQHFEFFLQLLVGFLDADGLPLQ